VIAFSSVKLVRMGHQVSSLNLRREIEVVSLADSASHLSLRAELFRTARVLSILLALEHRQQTLLRALHGRILTAVVTQVSAVNLFLDPHV